MLRQSWEPSRGLRAVMAARGVLDVGLMFVFLWFFFPRVLLAPILALSALGVAGGCVSRYRVLLDPAAGEVMITSGFWTKHVRLSRIERVDETARFAPKIKLEDGWTFTITPFQKRGRLLRLVKIRSGFEGMERAIMGAAAGPPHSAATDSAATDSAATDSAATDSAATNSEPRARSRGSLFKAMMTCLVFVAGLMSLAVAALVQPQTGGELVHTLAWLIRAFYVAGGVVIWAIGAGLAFFSWRASRALALSRTALSRTG